MSGRLDFDPIDPADRDLASQLESERPLPAAEFRGALGRHLSRHDPGYGPRPARLRAVVALYLAAGGATMVFGTLQAVGVL